MYLPKSRYFPNAIWINDTNVAKSVKKIKDRLGQLPQTEVFVFARGEELIRTAERICSEIDNCKVDTYEYTLGTQRACRYTLKQEPH